jgi:hypothetical protein
MMKNSLRMLMFVPLVGLLGVTAAHAQVTETIQFKTAFPFTVGDTTLPAGHYTIRPANDGTDLSVLEISNGMRSALLLVEPESPRNINQPVKDEVVFNKYGDRYVLSDIWDAADGSGSHVEMSPAEQRQIAQSGSPTQESVNSVRGDASGS